MNEKNQKNLLEEKTDNFQDEFELMDILLILWKRKFLIIGGALACALIAIIFSYAAPKQPAVYRAYMMLEPGVINLDQNGKKNYIDSPANIKALIESGILNNRISNSGKNSSDVGNSAALNFNVFVPSGLNVLKISYDTPVASAGIDKLKSLQKALIDHYSDALEFFRDDIDRKIYAKNDELKNFKAAETRIKINYEKDIQSRKDQINELRAKEIRIKEYINNIRKILFELESRVKHTIDSNKLLIEQRDGLALDSNKNAPLFAILSLNTIQQNLILEDSYRKQRISYYSQMTEAEDKLIEVQKELAGSSRVLEELEKGRDDIQMVPIFRPVLYKTQNQIENVKKEIEELGKEKQNIQNIKTLQPPVAAQLHKRHITTMRIAVLAAVIGLFLMVFLAFFLEYIKNYKKKVQLEKDSSVSE